MTQVQTRIRDILRDENYHPVKPVVDAEMAKYSIRLRKLLRRPTCLGMTLLPPGPPIPSAPALQLLLLALVTLLSQLGTYTTSPKPIAAVTGTTATVRAATPVVSATAP